MRRTSSWRNKSWNVWNVWLEPTWMYFGPLGLIGKCNVSLCYLRLA